MINKNLYFVLTSCCKLVAGLKRCTIIDYDRGSVYFISHGYYALLEKMNRQKLQDIENEIDDESKLFFEEFVLTMLKSEIGFLTETPECFPEISDEPIDEYVRLMNVIIEIDPLLYQPEHFDSLCQDLDDLRCQDFQVRFFSVFSFDFLTEIMNRINHTSANYVEIHCSYAVDLDMELIKHFIETQPLVSHIFIYGSPKAEKIEISNTITGHYPLELGHVYFVDYPFNGGDCCGIINEESLDFNSFYLHNQLKTRNGCLDRKITIDKLGNIKNCPSMKHEYGNIKDSSIKEIIEKEDFNKFWFINKDQISVCKVCEFRYNCTDCRAFLQQPDDIYSKPIKCGYDPSTCEWEDWSTNPIKEKGIFIS